MRIVDKGISEVSVATGMICGVVTTGTTLLSGKSPLAAFVSGVTMGAVAMVTHGVVTGSIRILPSLPEPVPGAPTE